MDDPNVEGLLSDPFSDDGLLAAENLHGQPVRGRFEDGHQPRVQGAGRPATAAATRLVVSGQTAVVRGGRGVRGVGRRGAVAAAAAGKARVLREPRVGRGLHGGGHHRRRRRQVVSLDVRARTRAVRLSRRAGP